MIKVSLQTEHQQEVFEHNGDARRIRVDALASATSPHRRLDAVDARPRGGTSTTAAPAPATKSRTAATGATLLVDGRRFRRLKQTLREENEDAEEPPVQLCDLVQRVQVGTRIRCGVRCRCASSRRGARRRAHAVRPIIPRPARRRSHPEIVAAGLERLGGRRVGRAAHLHLLSLLAHYLAVHYPNHFGLG